MQFNMSQKNFPTLSCRIKCNESGPKLTCLVGAERVSLPPEQSSNWLDSKEERGQE